MKDGHSGNDFYSLPPYITQSVPYQNQPQNQLTNVSSPNKTYSVRPERPLNRKKMDLGLVVSIVLLLGLGLITLYASSQSYALRLKDDALYFVKRQLLFLFCGLAMMVVTVCLDMNYIRRILPFLVIGTFVLCLLTFFPGIGQERNGARRWINVPGGGTLQPSEFAKLALILFCANLFDKKADRLDNPAVSIYPAALGLFLFVVVVYLQDDFSTSMFLLLLGLCMFYIAGVKLRWFFAFLVFAIPIAILFIFTSEFRVERLIAFLVPDYDVNGMNFQVNNAKRAITAGGMWGNGFGTGLSYVSRIPEVQADFIFAGFAEAMGFVGVIGYFIVLGYFYVRTMIIAAKCADRFRSLLAFGCGTLIFFQSLMNCAVSSGAMPATGIPLPFFSAGGTSTIVMMLACGLIINVSQYKTVSENEYE